MWSEAGALWRRSNQLENFRSLAEIRNFHGSRKSRSCICIDRKRRKRALRVTSCVISRLYPRRLVFYGLWFAGDQRRVRHKCGLRRSIDSLWCRSLNGLYCTGIRVNWEHGRESKLTNHAVAMIIRWDHAIALINYQSIERLIYTSKLVLVIS